MATKTELLIFFIAFYVILTVFIGFIPTYIDDCGVSSEGKGLSGTDFYLKDVVTGFSCLGDKFNLYFFGSLTLILLWIFVSSTAFFSGSGG